MYSIKQAQKCERPKVFIKDLKPLAVFRCADRFSSSVYIKLGEPIHVSVEPQGDTYKCNAFSLSTGKPTHIASKTEVYEFKNVEIDLGEEFENCLQPGGN